MYAHAKARLFKDVWYERVFANFIWIYSRVIVDNLSFDTAQMLSTGLVFFKSVNHFIAKLQLLLVLSLVLPTKQLYSCLSLNFTNQNLSFLIYPKHPHRRNAVYKTDPKKDCFMQAYRLNAFFVHTTIHYILLYNRLALFSFEISD